MKKTPEGFAIDPMPHFSVTRLKKLFKGKFIDPNKDSTISWLMTHNDICCDGLIYIQHITNSRETLGTHYHLIDCNCKKHIIALRTDIDFTKTLKACIVA